MAFVPLQDFSPRAEELISGLERRLSERSSASSPGHEEIPQVQLDMIKDKNIPDLEILVFPFNSRPDGAHLIHTDFLVVLPSKAASF